MKPSYASSKTLDKKTVQHNVDDDILTKQIFPRGGIHKEEMIEMKWLR
jgi:hypothetical protein